VLVSDSTRQGRELLQPRVFPFTAFWKSVAARLEWGAPPRPQPAHVLVPVASMDASAAADEEAAKKPPPPLAIRKPQVKGEKITAKVLPSSQHLEGILLKPFESCKFECSSLSVSVTR